LPVVAGVRLFVRFRICRVAAFLSLENVTRCGMFVNDFLPRCGRKFVFTYKKTVYNLIIEFQETKNLTPRAG